MNAQLTDTTFLINGTCHFMEHPKKGVQSLFDSQLHFVIPNKIKLMGETHIQNEFTRINLFTNKNEVFSPKSYIY